MKKSGERQFPNPEGKINVLKRYLHVLALMQHIPDNGETWNAGKLADLLSMDESRDSGISDSNIRKYIKDHIENELGIDVDRKQGGLVSTLAEDLDNETQLNAARVYSEFVIKDTTKDMILKKFIEAMPDRALWTMARIYFAVIERRMIRFNYTTNTGYKINNWKLCPYYFVLRNNNLYLAAWDPAQKKRLPLLAERIRDLTVLDKTDSINWDIPEVDELFKDSLSAYICDSGSIEMRIKYSEKIKNTVENIISILEPDIKQLDNGWLESSFNISDYLYLCKQFVLYGKEVEILSPPHVRKAMTDMLKESLSVYE